MNIAHLLPYSAKFPTSTHHGRYDWALRIAKAQAAKGHTVTMYCAPGSGEGIPELQWQSSPHNFGDKMTNNIATIKEALQHPEHDIFHSHLDFAHYFVGDATDKPIVVTQHWFPKEMFGQAAHFNTKGNVQAVAVTNRMREEDARLGIPVAETIYHGIDLDQFSFSTAPHGDRLVFVGRIAPHKGTHIAVQAAKLAGAKLDIIGKVNAQDEDYWKSILPAIDGEQIRYLGPKPHDEIPAIFASAKAFLFPSQQIESFGQTTVEAQACGTPVVISNIGASDELVQDGRSGFLANTIDEFVEAIGKIDQIDPADCRKSAERFNLVTMFARYEALYNRLVDEKQA